MSRLFNVNQNYAIDAGDRLLISFRYGNRGPIVWAPTGSPPLGQCYTRLRNDSEGHPKPGYLTRSERVDANGNQISVFCPGYYSITPINITNWCIVLIMEFTSTAGPVTEDPNKMYYVGKQSSVKYSTAIDNIPSLYTITTDPTQGFVLFNFTSLGTSTYQTNVNKSSHALGSTIGQRPDAYGMPFSLANYEVWGISPDGDNVKFLYGTIQINGGLVGGDISCI
jgi:hypothetical protein